MSNSADTESRFGRAAPEDVPGEVVDDVQALLKMGDGHRNELRALLARFQTVTNEIAREALVRGAMLERAYTDQQFEEILGVTRDGSPELTEALDLIFTKIQAVRLDLENVGFVARATWEVNQRMPGGYQWDSINGVLVRVDEQATVGADSLTGADIDWEGLTFPGELNAGAVPFIAAAGMLVEAVNKALEAPDA